MKNTEGPWKTDGGQGSSPARIYDSKGVLVALVEGDWQTSEPAKRAALMAAAPEMYEALESARYWLNQFPDGPLKLLLNTNTDGLTKIEKALARARGRT